MKYTSLIFMKKFYLNKILTKNLRMKLTLNYPLNNNNNNNNINI